MMQRAVIEETCSPLWLVRSILCSRSRSLAASALAADCLEISLTPRKDVCAEKESPGRIGRNLSHLLPASKALIPLRRGILPPIKVEQMQHSRRGGAGNRPLETVPAGLVRYCGSE